MLYLASSTAQLDAMVDERTHFTKGIDQILKQHSGNHNILFKELTQHVINNANTFSQDFLIVSSIAFG